jgi:hypothetical protein
MYVWETLQDKAYADVELKKKHGKEVGWIDPPPPPKLPMEDMFL